MWMELPRGFYSDERVTLANDFLSALHRTGHFDIVDREDMSAILEEQKFQASDLADEEEVVELGGLVGVDLFVTCTVKSVEGLYQITARLISVETGRVEKIVSRRCLAKVDFLTAMFNEVAFDLAGEVERKGWVLIETNPSEADVYLFGVGQGSTPLTLRLAPGPYLLSVERRGLCEAEEDPPRGRGTGNLLEGRVHQEEEIPPWRLHRWPGLLEQELALKKWL